MSCHGETMPQVWVHENHLAEDTGVGCVDCHMYPLFPAGEPVTQVLSIEDRPTGHTMHVTTTPCTTCHEVNADAQLVAVVETVPDDPAAQAGETTEAQPISSNATVPLIQGLLLGLGVGATAAAIIVARGNRRS